MRPITFLALFIASLLANLAPAAPLTGNKITVDGTYTVTTVPGSRYSFAVSGTFGSGSLAVNWNDGSGSGAYSGSPATTAENFTFTAATKQVDLVLTGATNPDLTITLVPSTGNSGTVTSQDIAAALGYTPATVIPGVRVTSADGSVESFTPSADTDTARGLALEAAFADSDTGAGDTIDFSPGNYYITKSPSAAVAGVQAQFIILDKMTVRFNGARLYKDAAAATKSAMFSISLTGTTSDWSIMGPGTIDGMTAYVGGAAASGNDVGIYISGGAANGSTARRYRITDLTIKNNRGYGLVVASYYGSEYGGGKYSTGHFSNCNFEYNYVNVQTVTEYVSFTNCSFNHGNKGIEINIGNQKFLGCEVTGNYTYGLHIVNGGNDGHGCFGGGHITHNLASAIYAEASMDNGYLFQGVTIGGSATVNHIESRGGGLTFVGCYIDCLFKAGATPTGLNTVQSCFFPQLDIALPATVLADMSAAERAKWKFKNNHTLTGSWGGDDIRTTYADDTAAGTGGVLQGELWQQTTTGAVFIKL